MLAIVVSDTTGTMIGGGSLIMMLAASTFCATANVPASDMQPVMCAEA